jgi:PAS domain S-box-containing protein
MTIGTTHPPKFRLRTTLVTAFVLQIVAAVSLVGYLSFRSGQQSVNDLVKQLQTTVAQRVEENIQSYLESLQFLNTIHAANVNSGELNPDDFNQLRRYFLNNLKVQNKTGYYIYANTQGNSLGVLQDTPGKFQLKVRDSTSLGDRITYELQPDNEVGRKLTNEPFDPRKRPFYTAAVAAGKPTWSPIFVSFSRKILRMDALMPLYADGQFRGVFSTEVTLGQISKFLNTLEISPKGKAFILERSGEIVASSTEELPFVKTEKGEDRLPAVQSQEEIIQATSKQILAKFQNLASIKTPQYFDFDLNNRRQLVYVRPYQDQWGLDWLVVVVIPEDDFMAKINANTQNTFLLTLAALAIAVLIGIYALRWISRPILNISHASDKLAQGDLTQRVKASPIAEIDILATSFNRMVEQLKAYITALSESEASNRALLEAIPDLMLEIDRDGVYLNCLEAKEIELVNQSLSEDILGKKIHDILPADLVTEYIQAIHQAIETQQTQILEYELTVGKNLRYYEARVVAAGSQSALFMVRDITKRKQAEFALQLANEELEARVNRRTNQLRQEKERSEQLLLNILPESIADRLMRTNESPAEHFEEATILFADIVGFTSLSARMDALQLVAGLNQIFSAFDQLTEKYELEKIKTIGDAYMVVGGLPISRTDHAEAIANMALDMQAYMRDMENIFGESLQIRIGINTGAVIAGVIGIKKFIYDLWGDAVNVASRMESHGKPGYIQVTEATYNKLKDQYLLEPRGTIEVKGRGEMMTYWLVGRRSSAS